MPAWSPAARIPGTAVMPPSIHSWSELTMALSKKNREGRQDLPGFVSEGSGLPLRELEALARARLPVLLPLLHSWVAREHPRPLELGPELGVELEEGPGNAVAHGTRLPRQPAATHVDLDVDLGGRPGELERLSHDESQGLAREVVLERPPVDDDPSLSGSQEHARDGGLSSPRAVELHQLRHHDSFFRLGNAWGCCAWCGCSPPRYTLSFRAIARPSLVFGSMPVTAHSTTRSG